MKKGWGIEIDDDGLRRRWLGIEANGDTRVGRFLEIGKMRCFDSGRSIVGRRSEIRRMRLENVTFDGRRSLQLGATRLELERKMSVRLNSRLWQFREAERQETSAIHPADS
jgi:hypothetical protein